MRALTGLLLASGYRPRLYSCRPAPRQSLRTSVSLRPLVDQSAGIPALGAGVELPRSNPSFLFPAVVVVSTYVLCSAIGSAAKRETRTEPPLRRVSTPGWFDAEAQAQSARAASERALRGGGHGGSELRTPYADRAARGAPELAVRPELKGGRPERRRFAKKKLQNF